MDGSWKTGDVWGGLKEGMVKMAPFNDGDDARRSRRRRRGRSRALSLAPSTPSPAN